jgi:hypothetical protein
MKSVKPTTHIGQLVTTIRRTGRGAGSLKLVAAGGGAPFADGRTGPAAAKSVSPLRRASAVLIDRLRPPSASSVRPVFRLAYTPGV